MTALENAIIWAGFRLAVYIAVACLAAAVGAVVLVVIQDMCGGCLG